MCKSTVVCLVLFVLASFASAQIPSGNVFIGYSHTSTNLVPGQSTGLNGWNGSVEGKVLPLLGLVADFSGQYGSQNLVQVTQPPSACPLQPLVPCPLLTTTTADISEYNFLFGPRISFTVGKFRPFVHALIGASHIRASAAGISNSETSFGDALGGGLDYHLIPLISWRIQADALQTRFFSSTQSNLRFSTGIVVHF
jgi:hypothetical protein